MVLSGELLPGQKVLQKELAEHLGVSRIPVREALAQLHAEGILDHRPNTGFTVGRFTAEDLAEIYLMRRLLETELIRVTDLRQVDVVKMRALHDRLTSVSPVTEPEEFQRLNQEFHFTLFEASTLTRVCQEVRRLWYMSGFYRSFYLHTADRWVSLQAEHLAIVQAIEQGQHERLIEHSNEHREWTERLVAPRLGRRSQPARNYSNWSQGLSR